MIREAYSQRGTMHKEHGLPNQDAVKNGSVKGYEYAIVCDGVSLKSDWTFSNSEIASKICTRSASYFLEQKLEPGLSQEKMTELLNETFQFTNTMLKETLEKANIPFFDCQTTMIIMIYRKGRLYGGIAGDGGILFMTKNGMFSMMITQVKTSSTVYPIGDEKEWRFFVAGEPSDPIVQALAATDGVFDQLISPMEDGSLAAHFDEIGKFFAISTVPKKQRAAYLKRTVEAVPSQDDKTAAVIIDTKMKKPLH